MIRALQILVGITVGLAGFLLFLVQPMIGRYILPWFGGSASTWTVCLLFFQGALLAGYLYAFAIVGRLPLRIQALLQIVLLVVAALTLPIEPSDSWKPLDASAPIQLILGALATSVGLPYAVLATTSPLLQRWMSLIDVDLKVIRYFAVSNFGSFVGLLSYPFLFEPLTSSRQQTYGWSFAFVAFALCFGACAVLTYLASRQIKDDPQPVANAGERARPESLATRLWSLEVIIWIGWAAGGTVLLLATTNLISEWISVVPFLWIIPLALYLLTFVLVFAGGRYYRREIYLPLFIVLGLGTMFIGKPLSAELLLTQIVLLSFCMFAGCMVCHGELVAKAPGADRLTKFYLAMSFGGFLGGALVTFAAPALLADIWEYHISILVVVACATYVEWQRQGALARRIPRFAFYVLVVAFFAAIAGFIVLEIDRNKNIVWQARNFYGVVKVVDDPPDAPERQRTMWQSAEDQGEEYLDPAMRSLPACDFSEDSALGLAIRYNAVRRKGGPNAPLRIGFIGMGVGMTLGYNKPGDTVRFYELNPAVVEAAHTQFNFVRDAKAHVDVILGDGRLSLERESKMKDFPKFDVLSMDAYRGASPPIHLVTKEAYEIYLSLLKPDGILLIDLDLDNFELAPLHRGMSQHFNIPVAWFDTPNMLDDCKDGVSWAVYTRDEGFWKVKRVAANRAPWPDGVDTTVMWTDQFSNIFSLINSHFVSYIGRALGF